MLRESRCWMLSVVRNAFGTRRIFLYPAEARLSPGEDLKGFGALLSGRSVYSPFSETGLFFGG